MNGFISRLITRHTEPGPAVSPRLPSKFESLHTWPISPWKTQSEEGPFPNEEDVNLSTEAKPMQPGSVMENVERHDLHSRPSFEADTNIHDQVKHPGTDAREKVHSFQDTISPVEKKHLSSEAQPSFNDKLDQALPAASSTNEKQLLTSTLTKAGNDRLSQKNFSTSKKSSLLIPESITPAINEGKLQKETIINTSNDIYPVSIVNIASQQNEKHTSQPPVIKVSIGRIEVRAITPPAKANRSTTQEPRLTLEAYLKQRSSEK